MVTRAILYRRVRLGFVGLEILCAAAAVLDRIFDGGVRVAAVLGIAIVGAIGWGLSRSLERYAATPPKPLKIVKTYPTLTITTLVVLTCIGGGLSTLLLFISALSLFAKLITGTLALLIISNFVAVLGWPYSPKVQITEARLARFLRPPRRLRFTREGKYFTGITFAVGFAAINTGNNLLYLLLGMMLSLIIASGILSEMSLRGLEVSRRPPHRLHATRPFLMGIALRNGKSRLPSFSIEVEDLVDEKPLDKKCYFLKVPAGRRQQTSYRHTVPRRGRYAFTGFRLSTKFPFALFRKSRIVEAAADVVVLPLVFPITVPPPPPAGMMGEEAQGRRGRHGDFHGLREFRGGDDPRDVHWRSSARLGRPMIREHEEEAARRVTLFVDNALPGGAECKDQALLDGLERAVSMAASLAAHYLERGFAIRLVARGEILVVARRGAPRRAFGRLVEA